MSWKPCLRMTTKRFSMLSPKDFKDGDVKNAIYLALKDREAFIEFFEQMLGAVGIVKKED